ncbi:helix-turn-helix transcriptional regulator [Chitinophagaceae bacterium 26-R-25]|nr:helix-turn-helix transcriptional regulator [Chitinophagaceae bacterium 26-R-25]
MVHVPLIKIAKFLCLLSMSEQTRIEKYIIQKVKEKRIEFGYSQILLSQKLNMSDSFVGHVETPKRRAKYNVNHLNALARVFKCSPRDFIPEKPL